MSTIVKGLTLGFIAIALSGCASIIAKQITSSKSQNIKGNLAEFINQKQTCDNEAYCIKTFHLPDSEVLTDTSEAVEYALKFDFLINDMHKVWRFKNKKEHDGNVGPLKNHLILLFAGYGQSAQLLYFHQRWLREITDATVIVVPSANDSKQFKFGLDFTSPIVAEIQRLKPEKVHLIGFSMGALAAIEVENKIDNAQLYLIAPMIDFEYSSKAIFDAMYKDKIYAKFISHETLEDAIGIIYEESGTTLKDTDLLTKLERVKSPTFLYASYNDKVIDHSAFETIYNDNIGVTSYKELSHMEMVALLSKDLRSSLVSDLLARPVSKNEISTLGILCDFDDNECLNQLSD